MSDRYTQGVCADGAAILKDGQMMTIEQILEELNEGWRLFKMPDAQRRSIYLYQRLQRPGYFNRADLCDTFGISIPQASIDIRRFCEDWIGHVEYNTSTKRYERRENAEG